MYCSVVVPTYNRRKTLERTLEALMRQTVGNDAYEVIVVDDGATDDTPAYMGSARARWSNVVYVRQEQNRGRTATRNRGIRTSRGEVVVLLDDDNVPEGSFVEAHLRYHRGEGGERVAVMGNARFAPEVIQGSNFGRYLQSRYLGCRPPRERLDLDYQDLPARCFGTLNCSVGRADLLRVGLLDEQFRFYGGEDEYLGYCLRREGVRILFGEDARTMHYDVVSLDRYRTKLLETARFGMRILAEKCPDYIESTNLQYLMPWARSDGFRTRVAKSAMRVATSTPARLLYEQWAARTDRVTWLFCAPAFRALSAAWVAHGYRSKGALAASVTYSDPS